MPRLNSFPARVAVSVFALYANAADGGKRDIGLRRDSLGIGSFRASPPRSTTKYTSTHSKYIFRYTCSLLVLLFFTIYIYIYILPRHIVDARGGV